MSLVQRKQGFHRPRTNGLRLRGSTQALKDRTRRMRGIHSGTRLVYGLDAAPR